MCSTTQFNSCLKWTNKGWINLCQCLKRTWTNNLLIRPFYWSNETTDLAIKHRAAFLNLKHSTISEINTTIVGRTCGLTKLQRRDDSNTTSVNTKKQNKALDFRQSGTTGVCWGDGLYLDDITIFDNFSEKLLVLRFILLLLQFRCMLNENSKLLQLLVCKKAKM